MVNKAIKCAPNESPITSEIKTNHLLPLGVSISCSHLKPSQTNKAINKDAIAYTSASVALNQKLSVNVKANEATKALPKIIIELFFSS